VVVAGDCQAAAARAHGAVKLPRLRYGTLFGATFFVYRRQSVATNNLRRSQL